MFCHSCGKKTSEMGLCVECFLKNNPIKVKDIEIPICACGRYSHEANWNFGIEKALKKMISENIVASPDIKVEDVKVEPVFEEKRIKLRIAIKGIYRGEEFFEEQEKDIKKNRVTCPVCSRITSSYYEAVVQFRVPVNAKKILDGELVTRTEKVAGGFDAYVTSAGYARKLGKDFARKGYIVKKSAKLVGKKNGEDLYRTFISIKSPGPQVGDIIKYKDKTLQILELGKSIRTKDLVQGKTLKVPPLHLKEAQILAGKDEVRKAMISSVAPNHLQLMDVEDYKTFDVPGTFPDLKEKDVVEYVRIGDDTYLL